MPEQIQSKASLLTLTAAKPPRAEASRETAADFGAELNAAVEETSAKPAESPAKESTTTKTDDAKAAAASQQTAEAEAQAAEGDDAAAEQAELETDENAEEAELLATFVVTETIVLETAPDAVLPENAITMIDVDAGVTLDAAGTSDAGADGSAAVDVNAIIEGVLDSEVDLTAQQTLATSSNASDETAQLAAAIQAGADEASANAVLQQSDGDGLLEQGATAATLDTVALEASSAVETDKASSKSQDAESQDAPEPTLASAAEAALAIAALPKESGSESGESSSTEAADQTEVNAVEGAKSRDAARAESADKAAPVERPTIDPARFVSRVSRAIEFADQRGGGPVELRLSPPELGSLQVKIQVKEGVMTAQLEVETPAARNALLDNLPALRDRLEQQQIRIDKFEVEVRDQQQQRGGDWRQHQDHRQQTDQQQSRNESRPVRQPAAAAPTPVDARAARTIAFANNGINLVV